MSHGKGNYDKEHESYAASISQNPRTEEHVQRDDRPMTLQKEPKTSVFSLLTVTQMEITQPPHNRTASLKAVHAGHKEHHIGKSCDTITLVNTQIQQGKKDPYQIVQ